MKQTGPISRRNGSSDSPMYVGAMSVIGRASLRLVLIFITAWRLPGSFCCRKYKCNKQINNRTSDRKEEGTDEQTNEGTKERTNERENERKNEKKNEWTSKERKNERLYGRPGWTDGRIDGRWMDGRMDEWIGGRKLMNECKCYRTALPYHKQ